MSKFIEIKAGELSIVRDEIIAIERKDEVFSNVITAAGTFESEIPYTLLVELLERSAIESEELGTNEALNELLEVTKNNAQRFDG